MAKHIAKAGKVVIFGLGGSGIIARDVSLRFIQLGIDSRHAVDSYHMAVHILKLNKNDVAIGISHSGRTKATLEMLGFANKQGAKTVAVTNYLGSALAKKSVFVLLTAFSESKVRATAIASHVAQLGIFDALYALVAKTLGSSNSVQRTNTVIEDTLRNKGRKGK